MYYLGPIHLLVLSCSLAVVQSAAVLNGSTCGGVIQSLSGTIEYKLDEYVLSYEDCVWTLIVPFKQTVRVRLTQDGFSNDICTNCQKVYIQKQKLNERELTFDRGIAHGDRNSHDITRTRIIQVQFVSLSSQYHKGKGFSLTFEGIGPDIDYGWAIYEAFPQNTPSGSVTFSHSNKEIYDDKHIFLTVSPENGKRIALTIHPHRLGNSYCVDDYDDFAVAEFNPYSQKIVTRFRDCSTNDANTTIYSTAALTVSFYALNQLSDTLISWENVDLD
jgi:hypothetical protein